MRVRITARNGYGDRYGRRHSLGTVVEYKDDLALKLIRLGVAVAVSEQPVETAELAAPENAARRTSKPRPRRASK